MENGLEVGDWVEVDGFKGYYEIVGFNNRYADEDNEEVNEIKGQYTHTSVTLKLVFTSTMKLRMAILQAAAQWVSKVKDDRCRIIQQYWKEHPEDYQKYQAYTVGNSIGYWSMELSVRPSELEIWKQAVSFLPQKFNMQQFYGWFNNNFWNIKKISEDEKIKGKKRQYYITFDLAEERLAVGKTTLYTNARIVFGR